MAENLTNNQNMQTPNNDSSSSAAPAAVHTMPDKFMANSGSAGGSNGGSKSGGKVSWIIITIIIVAVLAILGGAGFLIYTNLPSEETQDLVNAGQIVNENKNLNVLANANENVNINSNKNINNNKNSNSNENVNINSNTNSNVNMNENANVNANINTNTNTSSIGLEDVVIAEDNDNDGLSIEEEKLYVTKVDMPDTDKDGYKDGIEIMNGYNPNGDEQLTESDLAETYENEDYAYSIIYPAAWILDVIPEDDKDVLFMPSTENGQDDTVGEFIEVIVEANPYGFTALDWYMEQNSELAIRQIEEVEINGLDGVMSTAGNTVYFADSDYIYAINYSYGSKTELNFITTFKMMYNSFKLNTKKKSQDKSSTNTNINSNSNTNTNSNNNVNTTTDQES